MDKGTDISSTEVSATGLGAVGMLGASVDREVWVIR